MKTDIKKHENGGAKSWIKTHLSDIIPVLGLILVLVFFNAVSGGKVFTKTNFNTLFNEAFSLLIVTYALIFVMAQGKNDMSLGGVVALAAALAAHASSISGNLVLPVALLVGLLCGLLNGLIVTEFRIDSFIATIAMSFILKGFVELLLQSGVQSIPIKMMMLDSQQLKITVPRRLRSIFSIVFSIEILLSIIDMVLRSGSRADSRPERSAPPRRTAAGLRSCVPAGYTSVLFGCAHYICLTGNRQCLPCTVSGQNFVIETNPHFAPETVFDAKKPDRQS